MRKNSRAGQADASKQELIKAQGYTERGSAGVLGGEQPGGTVGGV